MQVQMGQDVYVTDSSSSRDYKAGKVTKVLPSGQFEVTIGQKPVRFNPDGRERGESGLFRKYVDTTDFDKRTKMIARGEAADKAVGAFNRIKVEPFYGRFYVDKGTLLKKVTDLQAQLEEVKALAEAIPELEGE